MKHPEADTPERGLRRIGNYRTLSEVERCISRMADDRRFDQIMLALHVANALLVGGAAALT